MTYMGVAVGFFTTFFVLTRWLSPEEIGLTRLLVEIATIASTLALLGLTSSISRYFPSFKEGGRRGRGEIFTSGLLLLACRYLGPGARGRCSFALDSPGAYYCLSGAGELVAG